jgi:hypothetical protein
VRRRSRWQRSAAGPIADANGNLFGTTYWGGAYGYDTVFEIAKTAGGYAGTPTTLVSFNGADGEEPVAGLASASTRMNEGSAFAGTYAFGDNTGNPGHYGNGAGYDGNPGDLCTLNSATGAVTLTRAPSATADGTAHCTVVATQNSQSTSADMAITIGAASPYPASNGTLVDRQGRPFFIVGDAYHPGGGLLRRLRPFFRLGSL